MLCLLYYIRNSSIKNGGILLKYLDENYINENLCYVKYKDLQLDIRN